MKLQFHLKCMGSFLNYEKKYLSISLFKPLIKILGEICFSIAGINVKNISDWLENQ